MTKFERELAVYIRPAIVISSGTGVDAGGCGMGIKLPVTVATGPVARLWLVVVNLEAEFAVCVWPATVTFTVKTSEALFDAVAPGSFGSSFGSGLAGTAGLIGSSVTSVLEFNTDMGLPDTGLLDTTGGSDLCVWVIAVRVEDVQTGFLVFMVRTGTSGTLEIGFAKVAVAAGSTPVVLGTRFAAGTRAIGGSFP